MIFAAILGKKTRNASILFDFQQSKNSEFLLPFLAKKTGNASKFFDFQQSKIQDFCNHSKPKNRKCQQIL